MYQIIRKWMLCFCIASALCSVCACSGAESADTDNSNAEAKIQKEEQESETEISQSEDSIAEEIAEYTCTNCKGTGFVMCPPCGGTGSVQCQQCEGTGGNCSYCGGPGMVDCATCMGRGVNECTYCKGSGKVGKQAAQEDSAATYSSEEIYPCPECQGEGRTGICANCGGDGWDENTRQICTKCLHTGKNRCERCDGYGMLDSNGNGVGTNIPSSSHSTPVPDYSTEQAHSECWICHGDGLCNNCGGTGRYEFNPEWAGDYCRTCKGDGRCTGCNGRGYNQVQGHSLEKWEACLDLNDTGVGNRLFGGIKIIDKYFR